MNSKLPKLRAQVEDEQRSLYVCPDHYHAQAEACLGGRGEQLLSKLAGREPNTATASQLYERQQHLQDPGLFGPRAPKVKQKQVTEAQLHSLIISNSEKLPGFAELIELCKPPAVADSGNHLNTPADTGGVTDYQSTEACSPLLRLLRRVSLWWYYRVMFDPLEQLVALSSSYELLFQLMTPHQQLSCMADILLVLACPVLQDQRPGATPCSAQLDTPLHTATLLTMLKMVQQLAAAEAELQEQQSAQHSPPAPHSQQSGPQGSQACDKQAEQCVQALQAAHTLLSPSAAVLRAARTMWGRVQLALCSAQVQDVSSDSELQLELPWPCGEVGAGLGGLLEEAANQQHSVCSVMATLDGQVSLQRSSTCKAVGAFLAQVGELPPGQLSHWWYSQELQEQLTLASGQPSAAVAVAKWLQVTCSALQAGAAPMQLEFSSGKDPVGQLLQWVLRAVGMGTQQQQSHRCKQTAQHPGGGQHSGVQNQQQHAEQKHQQQPEPGPAGGAAEQQLPHPAEALRQVLDVLLSALQYRHLINMHQWKLPEATCQGQILLLHSLHSHSMQLLAQARDELLPDCCTASSSGIQGGARCSDSGSLQQQQRQAWQLCVAQVQHNLLLVMQLSKHWQDSNVLGGYQPTFEEYMTHRHVDGFLPHFLMTPAEPSSDQTAATAQTHSTPTADTVHPALQSQEGGKEWLSNGPAGLQEQDHADCAAFTVRMHKLVQLRKRVLLEAASAEDRAKFTGLARQHGWSIQKLSEQINFLEQLVVSVYQHQSAGQFPGPPLQPPSTTATPAFAEHWGCTRALLSTLQAPQLILQDIMQFLLCHRQQLFPAAATPGALQLHAQHAAPGSDPLKTVPERFRVSQQQPLAGAALAAPAPAPAPPAAQTLHSVPGRAAAALVAARKVPASSTAAAQAANRDVSGPSSIQAACSMSPGSKNVSVVSVLRLRGGSGLRKGFLRSDSSSAEAAESLVSDTTGHGAKAAAAGTGAGARASHQRQRKGYRSKGSSSAAAPATTAAGVDAATASTTAAGAQVAQQSQTGRQAGRRQAGTAPAVGLTASAAAQPAAADSGAAFLRGRIIVTEDDGSSGDASDVFADADSASASSDGGSAAATPTAAQVTAQIAALVAQGSSRVGSNASNAGAAAAAAGNAPCGTASGLPSKKPAGRKCTSLLQSAVFRQWMQQAAPADGSTEAPVQPHQHDTQHDAQRSNGLSSVADEPCDALSDSWYDAEQDSDVLQVACGADFDHQFSALQERCAAAGASSDSPLTAPQQQGLQDPHTSMSRSAWPREVGSERGLEGQLSNPPASQSSGRGSITVEFGQTAAAAFGEASPGSAQLPVQCTMHAAVPGIAPQHAARLQHAIDLWTQRLASPRQPLQQPQQQQAASQPLSTEQLEAFTPANADQHIAACSTEHLMSWVELLRWSHGQWSCLSGTHDIKVTVLVHQYKLLKALQQLSNYEWFWPDPAADTQPLDTNLPHLAPTDPDLIPTPDASLAHGLRHPPLLGLLTMALSGNAECLFLHAADQEVMQEVTQILSKAVVNAYLEVVNLAGAIPVHLEGLDRYMQDYVKLLEQALEDRGREGSSSKHTTCTGLGTKQDFGAVLEASMGWTKLLTELLQELGPVNVRGASQALDQTTDNLHDELCTGSDEQVFSNVHHWAGGFFAACDFLRIAVDLDTASAHKGRSLQKLYKPLRQLQRILSAPGSDPVLAGLSTHVVHAAELQLTQALTVTVVAHDRLRAAINTSIARDAWGVIQRGYDLVCELANRTQNKNKNKPSHLDEVRKLIAMQLQTRVLGPVLSYLPTVSPYLPDCKATRRVWMQMAVRPFGGSIAQGWTDRDWQQVIALFATLRSPIASLWWMLPDFGETDQDVEVRSTGQALVCSAAAFVSSKQRNDAAPDLGDASRLLRSTQGSGLCSDSDSSCDKESRLSHTSLFSHSMRRHDESIDPAVLPGAAPRVQLAAAAVAGFHAHLAIPSDQDNQQHWSQEHHTQQLQQHMKHYRLLSDSCHKLLTKQPQDAWWETACKASINQRPLPEGSIGSTSSSSGSCSDTEQQTQSTGIPTQSMGDPQAHTAPSDGFRSPQEQQERLRQREVRRAQKQLARYDWGKLRPWHLQRAATMARRQLMLNMVAVLQGCAGTHVEQLQCMQAGLARSTALSAASQSHASSSFATSSSTVGKGRQVDCSSTQLNLCGTARQLLQSRTGPSSSTAAAQQLFSNTSLAQLSLQVPRLATTPASGSLMPSAETLLQHLQPMEVGQQHDQQQVSQLLQAGLQRQLTDQQWLQQVLGGSASANHSAGRKSEGVTFATVVQQNEQRQQQGVTTRQLLWEVLKQLKPAACHWYEAGAAHHHLQQGGASAAPASVPECTSPALWSTLTRSLASDLLLVPPSIRDLVGNGWAAGAGRLGAGGGGSSSGVAGVAARMLAVQYARAARRQYAKGFSPSAFVSQLLSLQLLSEEDDVVTELRPESAQCIRAALALHTDAAAAGAAAVLPTAALVAHCREDGMSSSCRSSVLGGLAPSSSRSSSCGVSRQPADTGSGQASASEHAAASSSSSSSSRGSMCSNFNPSLFQLQAQMGCCFAGLPQTTLPWLQLLARYHALAADADALDAKCKLLRSSHSNTAAATLLADVFDGNPLQWRLAAMAVTLSSLSAPTCGFVRSLAGSVSKIWGSAGVETVAGGPLFAVPLCAAPVHTAAAPLVQQLWQQTEGRLGMMQPRGLCVGQQTPHQQLQHAGEAAAQQQQSDAEHVDSGFSAVNFWLHAERLLRVPPAEWQQHLAEHLLGPARAGTSGGVPASGAGSSSSSSSSHHVLLLADLACDWCSKALPPQEENSSCVAATTTSSSRSSNCSSSRSQQTVWGCPSCGAAQYCSKACADSAKKVHNANCWRLQALARNGLCWQQPGYQRSPSSSRSRSFWDLAAVEPPPH